MKNQGTELDALVESILERSGDRSTRDLLEHMPSPDDADLFRVQAAVLAKIRSPAVPRRRWLPLVGCFVAATAAAGAWGLMGAPGELPAPSEPVAVVERVEAPPEEAAPERAVAPAETAADSLREAYRLLNRGAGDAAALAVVERGLAAAEDAPLRLLQIALLERLGRTADALEVAEIYLAAGWPEQRQEVALAAERFRASGDVER